MADNDDPQNNPQTTPQNVSLTDDPYDFDSLNRQSSSTGGDGSDSWYYRPSIGLRDWSARMGSLTPRDNTNATGSGNQSGTTDGQTEQTPDVSQNADGQALQDDYNSQRQANAQFGQKQALGLTASPPPVDHLDFMQKQPLQLQQPSAIAGGSGRRPDSRPNSVAVQSPTPPVLPPAETQQRGTAIENAANLPFDPQVGRNTPGHNRGFQDGDLMITHYGFTGDRTSDRNSNTLRIGNHNNSLNEHSLAISQNIARRYGLRIGDQVYVNGQYVGNYDDTAPEDDTIDAYDPHRRQQSQDWGGALRSGQYTISNHR